MVTPCERVAWSTGPGRLVCGQSAKDQVQRDPNRCVPDGGAADVAEFAHLVDDTLARQRGGEMDQARGLRLTVAARPGALYWYCWGEYHPAGENATLPTA